MGESLIYLEDGFKEVNMGTLTIICLCVGLFSILAGIVTFVLIIDLWKQLK